LASWRRRLLQELCVDLGQSRFSHKRRRRRRLCRLDLSRRATLEQSSRERKYCQGRDWNTRHEIRQTH
jgi:hypothetical protein